MMRSIRDISRESIMTTAAKSYDSVSSEFSPWTDSNATPLIQFQNVTKRYGDFVAIDNLSLDIYEREFFALLGPSGCGKTTMMRLLAGFEGLTEGRILLGGKDISHIPPNQRPVNMMFQSYALFPHMNVEQNIGFGLKQEGKSKAEIKDRVEELIQLVQLQQFTKRKPEQLSGGQRQRVALARSLAKKPKLLLLDEPLGALDKKLREQTQFELMNLQEQLGMTFMIVTHDQEEAMTVASRIAVMSKGELVQVDTPAQIYEAPKSRYVADFIGNVNFIGATVDSIAINKDAQEIEATLSNNTLVNATTTEITEIKQGDSIWLSLRPEKIAVDKAEPEGDRNKLKGTVIDIGYVGNVSTYHVQIAEDVIVKAQRVNRNRLRNRQITWDDEVWLHWNEDAALALDK
jgi:putrescine transport system ATP-binding protein